jgi:dimethylhistidine N-methyltransferase
VIAELGSGSGRKTRAVLEPVGGADYFPIDVSAPALERCRRELSDLARVTPIQASYLDGLNQVQARRNGAPLLVLFLGSTIGNFDSHCRADLLAQVRARLRKNDALLIGCDLVKPVATMLEAYDDPTGVTASFNLNLLGRVNRELGGDFDLRAFAHEARYDPNERRIEMHLRSRYDQTVTIRHADFRCTLFQDETIWTESSHKFLLGEIPAMARASGFVPQAQWVDLEWPFAESLWRAV